MKNLGRQHGEKLVQDTFCRTLEEPPARWSVRRLAWGWKGFSHIVTLIMSAKMAREGRSWLSAYHQELDKSDNMEARPGC